MGENTLSRVSNTPYLYILYATLRAVEVREGENVRTRPMNPKRLYSVRVCTRHLRGLTPGEEGVNFLEEGVNFLHGVFT